MHLLNIVVLNRAIILEITFMQANTCKLIHDPPINRIILGFKTVNNLLDWHASYRLLPWFQVFLPYRVLSEEVNRQTLSSRKLQMGQKVGYAQHLHYVLKVKFCGQFTPSSIHSLDFVNSALASSISRLASIKYATATRSKQVGEKVGAVAHPDDLTRLNTLRQLLWARITQIFLILSFDLFILLCKVEKALHPAYIIAVFGAFA